MNKLIILLILSLIHFKSSANPLPAATTSLPVVGLETFKPGKSWIWDYFEDGKIYSSEKYTVISVQGSNVLIEMSTQMAGETQFRVHHRIQVPLNLCLKAYTNPKTPMVWTQWTIQMLYMANGKWESIPYQKPLAFTEKFNCNPNLLNDRFGNQTLFSELEGTKVFQQKRAGKPAGSWYFLEGKMAGFAFQKEFPKKSGPTYKFILRP